MRRNRALLPGCAPRRRNRVPRSVSRPSPGRFAAIERATLDATVRTDHSEATSPRDACRRRVCHPPWASGWADVGCRLVAAAAWRSRGPLVAAVAWRSGGPRAAIPIASASAAAASLAWLLEQADAPERTPPPGPTFSDRTVVPERPRPSDSRGGVGRRVRADARGCASPRLRLEPFRWPWPFLPCQRVGQALCSIATGSRT